MDAECLRVTVNCILNTAYSKAQGAEWGHFNKLPPLSNAGGWVYSSRGLTACYSKEHKRPFSFSSSLLTIQTPKHLSFVPLSVPWTDDVRTFCTPFQKNRLFP